MRNLKRALSLTLASVMLLGMMVIGSSAAKGYPDVDDNDNVEAIEVLQAIAVMVGDAETGNFRPDAPVSRAEMAVVMGLLLDLDYNYYVSTCPFADVSGNYEWARGWVGACAANGIIAGRSATSYDPGATVTAIEAASMMMRALGYFQNPEDYADGFQVVTVRQGSQIGIFSGIGSDATTPMTRNQVAQLALNALRSNMVDFTGNLGVEMNGVKVNYRAEYTPRTSPESKYNAIANLATTILTDNGQYYIQLGEQLYDGKLRLNDNAVDDFGRPSRYWEYDGKAIGTYAKYEIMREEYTTAITGKDLYDLLGSDTIKDYSFDITIDGVDVDGKTGTTDNNKVLKDNAKSYFDETYMAKTYKSTIGKTGNGVLTQVFVDVNKKHVDVAVINTYLAMATADYSEKKDEASFEVYGLASTGSNANTVYYKYYDAANDKVACEVAGKNVKTLAVSGEDFNVSGVKKDDIVLVTVANGDVKSVNEPEVLAETTLNAFSKNKYVVSGSTQYDYNTTIDYDPEVLESYTGGGVTNLKDTLYNLYLDPYGYLIGVDVVEAVRNYIFLTGIDLASSNLKASTAKAAGILSDGTFVSFTMNMNDSQTVGTSADPVRNSGKRFSGHPLWNTWCTYTVDKDGVYTLKEVPTDPDFADNSVKDKAGQYHDLTLNKKNIDDKRPSLTGGSTYNKVVYGNNDSTYIVAEVSMVSAKNAVASSFLVPNDGSSTTSAGLAIDQPVVIISDVDSVSVGIGNTDLVTWNNSEIMAAAKTTTTASKAWPGNVYTLYGRDGYVIASVVVGEDTAATKDLVYVHTSDVKDEKYDATADEHTWVRDVIFNGEVTELREVGSGLSKLDSMTENTWYEVTFKADGTVKNVTHAYYDESGKEIGGYVAASDNALTRGYTGNFNNASFIDNALFYENMNVDGKSTYLYEEVWGLGTDDNNQSTGTAPANSKTSNKSAMSESNAPSLKGNTLYMNTNARLGIRVNDNVKSVLIQKNDGQTTYEYGDNINELSSMLNDLNYDETDNTYLFKISAVITNSYATVVIIHDWVGTGATTNGNRGDNERVTWINTDKANNFVNPTWFSTDGNQPTIDDIREMLESEGCTAITFDANAGEWSFTTEKGTRVTGQTINIAGGQKYKVMANGNTGYFAGSTSWNDILGATYAAATHGDYAFKTTDAVNDTNKVAMNTNYNVTADVSFDIGYYKVAADISSTNPTNANSANYTVAITKGEFVKNTADAEVELEVTTDAATLNTGIQLSVSTPASGVSITNGAVIKGAAGDYTVKLKVEKAQIVTGGVNIDLADADADIVVNVKTGASTTVQVPVTSGTKMDALLAKTEVNITGKAGVFFLVTESNGTTTKMIDTTDSSTELKDGDTVDATKKYIEVNGTTPVGDNSSSITTTGTVAGKAISVDGFDIKTGKVQDTAATKTFVEVGQNVVLKFNLKAADSDEKTGAAINVTVTADAATSVTVVSGGTIASGSDAETAGTEYTVTVKIEESNLATNITGATKFLVQAKDS